MKDRFPSLLTSCFALVIFGFLAFAFSPNDRNAEKTPWDNWDEKVLLPAFDFREQLAKDHGFSSSPPPSFTNDCIIGMYIHIEKAEQAAAILRDLHERKRLSPELKDETFGVEIAVNHPHDGWVSEENSIPPILVIRTMLPAPGRTEFQGIYQGRTDDVVIENGIGSVGWTFTPDMFYHPADGVDVTEPFVRTLADAPSPTEQEIADWRKRQKAENDVYEEMTSNMSGYYGKYYAHRYTLYDYFPIAIWATLIGFLVTLTIFVLFGLRKESRRRLLPLGIPTLLHSLLLPALNIVESSESPSAKNAAGILFAIDMYAPLAFFLFAVFYMLALNARSRMNRYIGLAGILFILNAIIQGVVAVYCLAMSQAG